MSLWTLLDRLPRPARGEVESIAAGPYVDSRPRFPYRLPDGQIISYIADHGDRPAPTITYQLAGGKIVTATYAGGAA